MLTLANWIPMVTLLETKLFSITDTNSQKSLKKWKKGSRKEKLGSKNGKIQTKLEGVGDMLQSLIICEKIKS